MARKKHNIEHLAAAVLERDRGTPYGEVLRQYQVTARQMYNALKGIQDMVDMFGPSHSARLQGIAQDKERYHSLFEMDEDYIRTQYQGILDGSITQLPSGLLSGPFGMVNSNIEGLVYIAFSMNDERLGSEDREEVLKGMRSLPEDAQDHFGRIKLAGLRNRVGSSYGVLEAFDRAYQAKTGDVSLFDLSATDHLHIWSDFKSPTGYWKSASNRRQAAYHILTELHPELAVTPRGVFVSAVQSLTKQDQFRAYQSLVSMERERVIQGIKKLPIDLASYFRSNELGGLLEALGGSTYALLDDFSDAYKRLSGDKGLFDLEARHHLHPWGDDSSAPRRYWQDDQNVADAIYHLLSEAHPELSRSNRSLAIDTIRNLPTNLKEHFIAIGMGGLMSEGLPKGEQNSPGAVLRIFDRQFSQKNGTPSMFDQSQPNHLTYARGDLRNVRLSAAKRSNFSAHVYDVLGEHEPRLLSADRTVAIKAICELPDLTREYMETIGLGSVMQGYMQAGPESIPLQILRLYDKQRGIIAGDTSLFDLEAPKHVHEWDVGYKIGDFYWQDTANQTKASVHILEENHPNLKDPSRKVVVETINSLPDTLGRHLHTIGLLSLARYLRQTPISSVPLHIMGLYDAHYVETREDASLFDLSQPVHVHRWDVTGKGSPHYWHSQSNVDEAVEHLLTEEHPTLSGTNRQGMIDTFRSMGTLSDHFESIGLMPVLRSFTGNRKESPKALIEIFDRIVVARGIESLLDASQDDFLRFTQGNRLIPHP